MLPQRLRRETGAAAARIPRPAVTPPTFSLQDKLDHIARERDLLALQSDLVRDGLREGDTVRRLDGGLVGRLLIVREDRPPRLLVRADDGTMTEYAPGQWRRI
jgi:hypothetical protein